MNEDDLKRKKNQNDDWLETEDEYIARTSKILPEFPKEVIETWFCEHNSQIDEFVQYPLERLKFSLEILRTDELPLENNGADYRVNQNINQLNDSRYQQNMEVYKWPMQNIKEYLFKYGTWPRPIIMLDNRGNLFPEFEGYPSGVPYHLMEGYRRVAVLKFYRKKAKLNNVHKVWVCSID